MAELTVLIVEGDAFLRQSITGELSELQEVSCIGDTDDPAGAQRLIAQHHPDVVLLEIGDDPDGALELAEWVRVEHPHTIVLGAAGTIHPELMRRAMRSGVHDLLGRPVDRGLLVKALDEARTIHARRQRSQEHRGQLTVVMGVSGGLGTTTIATNLAVSLANRDDTGSVVLADFDLVSGNVPCFLDLRAEQTYPDLLDESNTLDGDGLRQLLPRHRSGLFMLAGPDRLEDLDAVTHEHVGRTAEVCRAGFAHVVADAGHGLDDRRLELLDRADSILLVLQLNVASLHRAGRALEVLERLGYPRDRVKLVANRVERGSDVLPEDVEKSLGRPLSYRIPNDYRSVITAMDSGVPMVEARKPAKVATSIRAIGDDLLQAITAPIEAATGNSKRNGNGNGNGNGHAGRKRGPITRLLAR